MDKCKLCGEHPSSYVFDGVTRYHCAKKFKENSCPNSRTDFTPEQGAALMGEDQDAIRYRWLRNAEVVGFNLMRSDVIREIMDFYVDEAMAKEQGTWQPLPPAPEQEIEG